MSADPHAVEDSVPALPPALDHDVAAAVANAAAEAVDEEHHEHDIDPTKLEEDGLAASPAGGHTPRRQKKLPLSKHEAIIFSSRGIYVDVETAQLRCSCNHKPCHKWDAYGYTRHFSFKCHKKYEDERLDDAERMRLREARETFLRMNPLVEEASLRKRRKLEKGEKLLSVEELRVQERHWMEMWKEAKDELKQLREDLKNEGDEEVRAELMADIEGLRRRKGDWAKLLGINEASAAPAPAPPIPAPDQIDVSI